MRFPQKRKLSFANKYFEQLRGYCTVSFKLRVPIEKKRTLCGFHVLTAFRQFVNCLCEEDRQKKAMKKKRKNIRQRSDHLQERQTTGSQPKKHKMCNFEHIFHVSMPCGCFENNIWNQIYSFIELSCCHIFLKQGFLLESFTHITFWFIELMLMNLKCRLFFRSNSWEKCTHKIKKKSQKISHLILIFLTLFKKKISSCLF